MAIILFRQGAYHTPALFRSVQMLDDCPPGQIDSLPLCQWMVLMLFTIPGPDRVEIVFLEHSFHCHEVSLPQENFLDVIVIAVLWIRLSPPPCFFFQI